MAKDLRNPTSFLWAQRDAKFVMVKANARYAKEKERDKEEKKRTLCLKQ